MQSVLSSIGVAVGVAAVTSVMAIGAGVHKAARESLSVRTDREVFRVAPRSGRVLNGLPLPRDHILRFDEPRVEILRTQLGEGSFAALYSQRSAPVMLGNSEIGALHVTTTQQYGEVYGVQLLAGAFLPNAEPADSVPTAVVDTRLTQLLTPGMDSTLIIGQFLLVGHESRRVVGLVSIPESNGFPHVFTATESAPVDPGAMAIAVSVPTDQLAVGQRIVQIWLLEQYSDPSAANITSNLSRLEDFSRQLLSVQLILGAFAAITIFVSAIGIANMLLASISERGKEIGVRRSLGARRSDIRLHFLFEAFLVAGTGSVLGVLGGLFIGVILSALLRQTGGLPVGVAVTWESMLVTTGTAIAVGIASGAYPAKRAAGLDPAVALRME